MTEFVSYFESHSHLHYFKENLGPVLDRARLAGVKRMVTVAVDEASLNDCRTIADRHEDIYFSAGIHPHECKDLNDSLKSKIEKTLEHPKAIAVGETGLDYHYMHSSKENQIESFRWHLNLGRDLERPVIVHCREAADDVVHCIRSEGPSESSGVVHCFVEDAKTARNLLDLNFYLGITGIVTFKNAQALRDVVKTIPLDRLLIETDCPYLAPLPHRGKQNEPAFLPEIAQTIANEKGITLEVLAEETWKNGCRLFKMQS